MRLLHARDPARRALASGPHAKALARADKGRAGGQPLPLYGLREDHRGGGAGGIAAVSGNGLKVVGRPLPKVDAMARVTGTAVYADDIKLPRMLHCKILRAQAPHARIKSIDTSAARRLPGVVAVI